MQYNSLKSKIDLAFKNAKDAGWEIDYVIADIKWKSGEESKNLIIALKDKIKGLRDDDIFFYCKDYQELLSLCCNNKEDFIITDVKEFC